MQEVLNIKQTYILGVLKHLDFLVPMSQYWYTVSENDPYIYAIQAA